MTDISTTECFILCHKTNGLTNHVLPFKLDISWNLLTGLTDSLYISLPCSPGVSYSFSLRAMFNAQMS